ncbi:MAG: hypothetical protein ACE5OS_12170 [Anaerolineae bacterium]
MYEGLKFEEVSPRAVGRGRRPEPAEGRRIGVTVLGVILAAVACGVAGAAFMRGSWWYPYGTDRALDDESLACLERMRDEVAMWLDAALEPHTHPTDVRAYLIAAQEALGVADDPKLAEAVEELQVVIETIRPTYFKRVIEITPYPATTLEWP